MSVRAYGKSVQSYSAWASVTAYSVDDIRVPSTLNGKCYICTIAGTSGSTEPTWSLVNDATVNDFDSGQEEDHVTWMCMDYEASPSALSVTLDKSGCGGYSAVDVWMKSDGSVTFLVQVSFNGADNTWRQLDSENVNDAEELHQYKTPYNFIKVSTETVASNEIEIVAGE